LMHWFTLRLTPLAMCGAGLIGSFLPDVDSDSGTPFELIFNLCAALGGGLAFYYLLVQNDLPWIVLLVAPPAVYFAIRYGLGAIFRRFTRHRGIFHSIPTLLIAALLTPIGLQPFGLPADDVVVIALCVGLGFFSHLLLDEIYATVNFEGHKISQKSSFGSALKFVAPSKRVTLAAYVLLLLLILYNWPVLTEFISASF
jgi:membrane-bound metal-dependent hydrolase YbcI (DUF457 family)